jgi:hypothetical protein
MFGGTQTANCLRFSVKSLPDQKTACRAGGCLTCHICGLAVKSCTVVQSYFFAASRPL